MSITVKQEIQTTTNYENFGVSVEGMLATTEITYTIERIDNFDGRLATGVFTVQIGETYSSERFRFIFKYSGEGNPLDQAESALKDWFDSQAEITDLIENDLGSDSADQ
ncbi:hypothetical protein [Pantoea vagans]|uniref:hypothetical protein n=1 Tax=Pantoea vagans TaxID=470934 RepID=UPI00241F8A56|nr:hypothetical protein [Pantoea vagans]